MRSRKEIIKRTQSKNVIVLLFVDINELKDKDG